MPIVEDAKSAIEWITGFGRPPRNTLASLVRSRKAHPFRFDDDGRTPNNPNFPLVWYRSPVFLAPAYDPAAIFEELFAVNGWKHSWRDGIYDFLHFHTRTHEVLGIARGHAKVEFGGSHGRTLEIKAGDVVVLPAGTGHRRMSSSRDLLVVGAYPAAGEYDEPNSSEVDHDAALASVVEVGRPPKGPVYGGEGQLLRLWKPSRKQCL